MLGVGKWRGSSKGGKLDRVRVISREEEIFGQEPANIPTARKASGYSNKRLNRQGIIPSDATPMAKPFMSRLWSGLKGYVILTRGGGAMDG